METVQAFVAAGLGISLVAAAMALRPSGPDAAVIRRPLRPERASRRLGLIHRSDRPRACAAATLADFLREATRRGAQVAPQPRLRQ